MRRRRDLVPLKHFKYKSRQNGRAEAKMLRPARFLFNLHAA